MKRIREQQQQQQQQKTIKKMHLHSLTSMGTLKQKNPYTSLLIVYMPSNLLFAQEEKGRK